MILVDLYRTSLEEILARSDGRDCEGCKSEIIGDQLPIFQILDREGSIRVHSFVRGGQPEKPKGWVVSYDVLPNLKDTTSVVQRLKDLDLCEAKHPDFLGRDEGQTVTVYRGNGFVCYGNGLTTYRGTWVDLSPQLSRVLSAFMSHYKNLLFADDILQVAESKGRDEMTTVERSTAASKIISPLNKVLRGLIGYDPIRSALPADLVDEGRWILDFDHQTLETVA